MKRKGLTMIEIVIVMGILALAIIPIYNNIIGVAVTVTKAEFSYIAVQLARETLEEAMAMPFEKVKSFEWKKIKGPVVSEELLNAGYRESSATTGQVLGGTLSGEASGGARLTPGSVGQAAIDSTLVAAEGDYPVNYSRFEVRQKVSNKGKGRFKMVKVEVRWHEKGERDVVSNKYLYSASTLIANHHLAAYK